MSIECVKIGTATLYHGDMRDVLPSLSDIGSCICDPPYGMNFQSNYRSEKHSIIANDKTADVANFAIDWARQNATHSVYAFGRWDNVADYPKPKSLITWVKNNWSMGDLQHEHARQTEVIFFYQGKSHSFPKQRPTDVVYADRTGNENHPTEKPVKLIQQVLGWTTGTVLDCFMGSGTTGVACMNLDRKFIGIEIDRKYFDIACERIQRSQQQCKLFDTGTTWQQAEKVKGELTGSLFA